jgi:hypothetical protein
LLEPYHETQIPKRHREPPAPVKIEGQRRVWSSGGPGLQEDSWKAPVPCLLARLPSFWSYLGACWKPGSCPRLS